ncbi:sigma-54 dependent transcriptional regulator [Ferrimonas pelagia]|uniref:Sigma-54 dependent transcriptional regulator n=1 Tax=Ferrimonas pelagia TaxID=1177826 RepID=A0ABP9FIZ6_9GAMM
MHEILLVEDSGSIAALYQTYLKDEPVSVSHVTRVDEALAYLQRRIPALILLDLNLPDQHGGSILREVHDHGWTVPIVVITGNGSVESAVEAMRLGAYDFLIKPTEKERLLTTVRNAIHFFTLNSQLKEFRKQKHKEGICGFIGASPIMQGVYHTLEQAASSTASVFVVGESGTGKELAAQALHSLSEREQQPFIAVNCAAIPKDLFESELFGHSKGAFTGASKDRLGAVRSANKGTLFLDEICEMPLDLQTKLLRFLQTGIVTPVGTDKGTQVDVRIVCATNRDPWVEVDEGNFREDLYYRLHVIPVMLPPLRQRGDDILLLARRFLKQFGREEGKSFAGFSAEAERMLKQYPWPGNVRQLQNVIRQICVMHPGGKIAKEQVPRLPSRTRAAVNSETTQPAQPTLTAMDTTPAPAPVEIPEPNEPIASLDPPSQGLNGSLAQMERNWIEQAIEQCDGNITKAAGLLDVSPSTIYRKLQSWQ